MPRDIPAYLFLTSLVWTVVKNGLFCAKYDSQYDDGQKILHKHY